MSCSCSCRSPGLFSGCAPVPDRVLDIVLHGPESTGKSTLAAQLAAHFGTVWVPEYGRTYCEINGIDLMPDDLIAIMKGHVAAREAMGGQTQNGLIIQDTDPLMTAAWSMMLFGHRLPELDAFGNVGDLYLLMENDLPFVQDSVRMFADCKRQERFMALCEAELLRRAVPYVRIGGSREARFECALLAIREYDFSPNPRSP
jgi:NadR type nicotinamide-nucleotide adenylyltransferase